MTRASNVILALAALAAAPLSTPMMAQGPGRTMVGTLACDISGGIGWIVASRRDVACTFTPSQPGRIEGYIGSISKLGLDVGGTTGGALVWAVYAPTDRRFDALAGHYAGPSGEATVGAGLGANILVGGSDRTVVLQPLSVQGQMGLNLAVGVAAFDLYPAP